MQKFLIIFGKQKVHQCKRSSKKALFIAMIPISTLQASFFKAKATSIQDERLVYKAVFAQDKNKK